MLLEIAKKRAKNERRENNLMTAAHAADKVRVSQNITVDPELVEKEMQILDGIIKKEETHA